MVEVWRFFWLSVIFLGSCCLVDFFVWICVVLVVGIYDVLDVFLKECLMVIFLGDFLSCNVVGDSGFWGLFVFMYKFDLFKLLVWFNRFDINIFVEGSEFVWLEIFILFDDEFIMLEFLVFISIVFGFCLYNFSVFSFRKVGCVEIVFCFFFRVLNKEFLLLVVEVLVVW